MNPPDIQLIPLSKPDHWADYHRICKAAIFDGSGITYDPNHESLRDPHYRRFVFIQGETLLGILVIELLEGPDAIIRIIAIDEPYRNHGLGTICEKLGEDWIHAQGKTRIFLHADPKAINFYHRLGYHEMPFPNGDQSIFDENIDMVLS